MKKILILLLFFAPVFVSNTNACTCIGGNSVKIELRRSDFVFVGKVISKSLIEIRDTLGFIGTTNKGIWETYESAKYVYKVEIITIYKGKSKSKIIEIITGIGDGDCGFTFEIGKEYIIYSEYKKKIGRAHV